MERIFLSAAKKERATDARIANTRATITRPAIRRSVSTNTQWPDLDGV
ncbi:hypothetical protein RKLH11_3877 [Rhodobacteraceae bacterium KLH11]|nr:hypothetical protein RKLH11_3877 [Rhodobacteraceae bacterium KLH11]